MSKRVISVDLGALLDVCFTPESEHQADEVDVRFVPIATIWRRSTQSLFDNPVGASD